MKSPRKKNKTTPSNSSTPLQRSGKTPRTPPPRPSTRMEFEVTPLQQQGQPPKQLQGQIAANQQPGRREPPGGKRLLGGDSQPGRQRQAKRARESPGKYSPEKSPSKTPKTNNPSDQTLEFLDLVREVSTLLGGEKSIIPRKNAIFGKLSKIQRSGRGRRSFAR